MATEPPVTAEVEKPMARLLAILLRPGEEWRRIAGQEMSVIGIFALWVVPLALIDPVSRVLAIEVLGFKRYGTVIDPPQAYLVALFVGYWLAGIATVWLLSLAINLTAQFFDAEPDGKAALKLAAYGWTAMFLSGLAQLHPWLSYAGLAGYFCFVTIGIGLPVLMKAPEPKLPLYVVAVVVAGLLAQMATSWVAANIADSYLPVLPGMGI